LHNTQITQCAIQMKMVYKINLYRLKANKNFSYVLKQVCKAIICNSKSKTKKNILQGNHKVSRTHLHALKSYKKINTI